MVAFVSAGLGLGHKDFDGYRGRLRSTRVLWWLQGLAEDDEYSFCGHEGLTPAIRVITTEVFRGVCTEGQERQSINDQFCTNGWMADLTKALNASEFKCTEMFTSM